MQYIDQEHFLEAKQKIVGKRHNDKGIGTLSEKSVHGVLKWYFEPDADCHEVALDGYFADIYNQEGVIEIQTRSFDRLREKLAVFLNHYPVTIVYPLAVNTWVFRFDEETGEVLSKRKSPIHRTVYDAFVELYKIKQYLKADGLKIKIVFLEIEEYRLISRTRRVGRKTSDKYDRIPLGITDIVSIDRPEDYMQFVPYELEEEFTSAKFAQACKIGQQHAALILNILHEVGVVHRVGKRGKAYLYRTSDAMENLLK